MESEPSSHRVNRLKSFLPLGRENKNFAEIADIKASELSSVKMSLQNIPPSVYKSSGKHQSGAFVAEEFRNYRRVNSQEFSPRREGTLEEEKPTEPPSEAISMVSTSINRLGLQNRRDDTESESELHLDLHNFYKRNTLAGGEFDFYKQHDLNRIVFGPPPITEEEEAVILQAE